MPDPNANRGLKALARRDMHAAIKSVPNINFSQEGTARMKFNDQQYKGVKMLGSKIGSNGLPVWDVGERDNKGFATITHHRISDDFRNSDKTSRRLRLAGFITFDDNGQTSVNVKSEEHHKGLELLCQRENWDYTFNKGTCYIAKRYSRRAA